jgi:hypothetical protein
MRSSAMVIPRFVFKAFTEFPASSHVGLHLLATDPGQVNGGDCGLPQQSTIFSKPEPRERKSLFDPGQKR